MILLYCTLFFQDLWINYIARKLVCSCQISMDLLFLYNGITFAILRISGKIPWLRDRLHMYDRGPWIYGIINLRGPKRISSYPGAESFSKFKMFLISWLETGVRNNEFICLSLRYLSGETLCPSKDLDKFGPILTKNEFNFSQIVLLSLVISPLDNLNLICTWVALFFPITFFIIVHVFLILVLFISNFSWYFFSVALIILFNLFL